MSKATWRDAVELILVFAFTCAVIWGAFEGVKATVEYLLPTR